jgi:hypothetical protein
MSEIRKLPAQAERVETGPVQFGDDWPGVFIRGDNAFYIAMCLRRVVEHGLEADPLATLMLKGFADTLAASDLTGLSKTLYAPAASQEETEQPKEGA